MHGERGWLGVINPFLFLCWSGLKRNLVEIALSLPFHQYKVDGMGSSVDQNFVGINKMNLLPGPRGVPFWWVELRLNQVLGDFLGDICSGEIRSTLP